MKKIVLIMIALMLLVPATVMAKGGFDEFGYNDKARMFNGFYGYYDGDIEGGFIEGTYDMWMMMKWSKDWKAMADQPIGAWVTNELTWYTKDIDTSFYGYENRLKWNEEVTPDATYRVVEKYKIMKVSDDTEAWAEYEAAGAYNADWGTYESGVPKYVVFQDTVNVYDAETGKLLEEIELITGVKQGLGQPIF